MNEIIKNFINENPQIEKEKRGFPNLGKRHDGEHYSDALRKMEDSWYFYDYELYKIDNRNKIINLGNGNPINYKPFIGTIKNLKKKLKTNMYEYGAAAGDEEDRNLIASYLIKEGFNSNMSYKNVIVTDSTTAAFSIIIKTLFNENDVILMTSPNYGLFTFMPERENLRVELLELKEDDDYKVNPKLLDENIKRINNKLKNKYKNSKYIPRVKAFFNSNPHNPMGTVMGIKDISLLDEIGKVCFDNKIFIIDDLIYRDLSYDRSNIAKPIGTIDKYFDNTISLFGLSKSYGLAKARSGLIVANETLIRAFRDQVFYLMDSTSSLQTAILAGAYNPSKKRYSEYKKYFNKLIPKYIFNRDLCIALINGVESLNGEKNYSNIKHLLKKKLSKRDYNLLKDGIKGLNVIYKPESGFFMLIDFSSLRRYDKFNREKDILEYLYRQCSIKFLVGQSFSWPNTNQNIIRISYSLNYNILIESLNKINKAILEVKNETDRDNNACK